MKPLIIPKPMVFNSDFEAMQFFKKQDNLTTQNLNKTNLMHVLGSLILIGVLFYVIYKESDNNLNKREKT
jgi:hypothetical protein